MTAAHDPGYPAHVHCGLRFIFILALLLPLVSCGDDDNGAPPVDDRVAWAHYGGSLERTFFNPRETTITAANAAMLIPKWRYLTGAVITASPSVAYVDLPDEGDTKVVFAPSWDGRLYALRASNGSRVWSFSMKTHPGASFPQASSAEIVTIDGEQRVYIAGGMTMYCLSAATGQLLWQFDAGSGCTDCDVDRERNEILSSAAVFEGKVFFGMDVNDEEGGKGGAYAVDARAGHLIWYLDLETEKTCRPRSSDRILRFDGYHSATELGLPADFLATRPGCDFERTRTGCGNIWSSFAVDTKRRLLYSDSSNCDTDEDPNTAKPPPPMPRLDEAIFAITPEGNVAWTWRPREVDNDDLAFGGVPNLFKATVGGVEREVVGVGNKDGTYYLLDRDGTNEMTGTIEPYWSTNVVPGGAIGGVISSAAVGDGRVLFSTAVGLDITRPQRPNAFALSASDGALLWSSRLAAPSFGPTTAIPGVTFMGGLRGILGSLSVYDAQNGGRLLESVFDGPVSSAAAIVDGEVFVGEGTGARGGSPAEAAFQQSVVPSHVNALCLSGTPGCQPQSCNDGNPCTYDFNVGTECQSEDAPEDLPCGTDKTCHAGQCL